MAKIDELEAAVNGILAIVPNIAADYQALIGLVADLQHRLESAPKTSADPALQQRISDLTTKANGTLDALKALDASFDAAAQPEPPAPVATPEQQ